MNNRAFRLFVAGGLATSGLVAAGTALGASAASGTTISIPAPPAVGSASAVQVGNIVSVGSTSTGAGSGGASAAAVPVSVLGHPVLGGTQVGSGAQSGALIDTGATPVGRVAKVQVAPWSVAVSNSSTSRSASASSSAAHADVPNVVGIDILKSSSSSTHTGMMSAGQAVSDGAIVRVGGPNGIVIHVLHSEADSQGHGRTYLVAVGNLALLDDTTVGAVCRMAVPSLLQLTCLSVAGGVGGMSASDLNAVIGEVPALSASALTAGATGGTAQTAGVSTSLGESTLPNADQLPLSGPAAATTHAAHGLAFTGMAVRMFLVIASVLIALGSLALAVVRRRGFTAA